MTAWYNEPDPYAAAWLRNLIAAGLIAPGVVDERKIQDVEAWELFGYTQCHFFAGIGIWSGALRAAGWPDDAPIWTGSCPCQPFSNAGKRKGTQDERHLWPTWFKLIEQCKPPVVVGEQVASKDGLGWLDLVSADMERAGYAIGASDLCAAGFGQAHIRQRLYFVGLGQSGFESGERDTRSFHGMQASSASEGHSNGRHNQRHSNAGQTGGLADALHAGRSERGTIAGSRQITGIGAVGGLADDDDEGSQGYRQSRQFDDARRWEGENRHSAETSVSGGLADSEMPKCEQPCGSRARRFGPPNDSSDAEWTVLHSRKAESLDDADWLLCRNPAGEPSWRPVESGTFPLAHGLADRMGKLRAYGNALDFKTAQGFCEVVAEIVGV